MSFGGLNVASTRHAPDMLQHVAKFLVNMYVRSPICQRPGGGADPDMSVDADISAITLMD